MREYRRARLGRLRRARGPVDAPLGRHPHHREKMAVVAGARGRDAVTHWRVEEALGPATLVACRLETGRTHQIRVHLAHIGHPLLGDSVYGAGFKTKASLLNDSARQALARSGGRPCTPPCWDSSIRSPGEPLLFESAPPEDFANLVRALREPERASHSGRSRRQPVNSRAHEQIFIRRTWDLIRSPSFGHGSLDLYCASRRRMATAGARP